MVHGTSTADTDEATFDQVYAVNVKTPFLLTGLIAPKMAERGSGAIINLGSWVARLGIPMAALYASTKGAMETLTRMWAAEYGSNGVRVNAISPGVIAENAGESPGAAMMRGTPAKQSGTPDQIANAAIYLASDESTFVHVIVIVIVIVIDVDRGRTTTAVFADQPHTNGGEAL